MPLKPSKQQQKFFYATKGFCSQVDCTDWPGMTNKKTLPIKIKPKRNEKLFIASTQDAKSKNQKSKAT